MIVLDTHAWIWFSGDDRFLSAAALDARRGRSHITVRRHPRWHAPDPR
jgi:PIN domain nuclease of toxin-antitoxin system